MSRRLPSFWLRLALAGLVVAAIAACGKRSELAPPEGEESRYTYPRPYPDPASVLPPDESESAPASREVPTTAGDLSPFPDSRRTTTYGQPPVQ
ncbi:MAG: hypothetical protein D6826_05095 [Alphaproteobacteria bacterium]|nr:MAG: hypothetical protein D6826_05095 [Alphaproteobacteria bacterium]